MHNLISGKSAVLITRQLKHTSMPGINKAIARRIIQDIFIDGNILHLEELVSANVIVHDTDQELYGLSQFRHDIITLRTAFPDLHYIIHDLLADKDKVILRCTATCTHLGPFRGIAATGKAMSYSVILIWRFSGARLCEHWSVSDMDRMLQQPGKVQPK